VILLGCFLASSTKPSFLNSPKRPVTRFTVQPRFTTNSMFVTLEDVEPVEGFLLAISEVLGQNGVCVKQWIALAHCVFFRREKAAFLHQLIAGLSILP